MAKSWQRGPLNAQRNCVAFHMLSFQLCRNTGQKRQNRYDLAAYISEAIRQARNQSGGQSGNFPPEIFTNVCIC